MSQPPHASKAGPARAAQYLNDIEHVRRNAPSEYLIGQMAAVLSLSADILYLAAGGIDLSSFAVANEQNACLLFGVVEGSYGQ